MDQACFPSGLNDTERTFCVKNIPVGFKDWDLFHTFRKYGIVHSVKIPAKQSHVNSKYGFLVMEDFNGADEIRYQLKSGKFSTDSGVCLQVSSVHRSDNQRAWTDGESVSRPPFKDMQNTSPTFTGRNRFGEKHIMQKSPHTSTPIRCSSQDLPLRVPINVRVVESPHPCESVEEGFLFHVVPVEQELSEDYTKLQRDMNKFCMTNPNKQDLPRVGEYALYGRASVAYRALCNSEKTMYLIDIGEVVPINRSQLWEIIPAFTRLPCLVIPCGIADISWRTPSATTFNKYRNALSVWSKGYATGLRATACAFCGLRNLVNLDAVSGEDVDDFATCITSKGVCTRVPHKRRIYSREDILDVKTSTEGSNYIPTMRNDENIAEIVVGMKTVTVA